MYMKELLRCHQVSATVDSLHISATVKIPLCLGICYDDVPSVCCEAVSSERQNKSESQEGDGIHFETRPEPLMKTDQAKDEQTASKCDIIQQC